MNRRIGLQLQKHTKCAHLLIKFRGFSILDFRLFHALQHCSAAIAAISIQTMALSCPNCEC